MENKNIFLDKFDISNVVQYHENIKKKYVDSFSSKGYDFCTPINLVAGNVDLSTIFIGSTISALKPLYISKKISEKGNAIVQPCIRTHNRKTVYDKIPSTKNTFFNLVGGIHKGERFTKTYLDTLDFILPLVGKKNEERLYVQVSPKDQDILACLSSVDSPLKIEVGTKLPESYRWKYGIEGVIGRGISIGLKNNSDKKGYTTFGNIILMGEENKTTATQWGYGIESIVKGIFMKDNLMECSAIGKIIPYTPEKAMFMDLLSGSTELINSGLEPAKKDGKAKRMLRFFVRALPHIKENSGISDELFENYIKEYCNLKNMGNSQKIWGFFSEANQDYKKNVNNLCETIKKINSGDDSSNPKREINELSNKYKLHPKIVSDYICKIS